MKTNGIRMAAAMALLGVLQGCASFGGDAPPRVPSLPERPTPEDVQVVMEGLMPSLEWLGKHGVEPGGGIPDDGSEITPEMLRQFFIKCGGCVGGAQPTVIRPCTDATRPPCRPILYGETEKGVRALSLVVKKLRAGMPVDVR